MAKIKKETPTTKKEKQEMRVSVSESQGLVVSSIKKHVAENTSGSKLILVKSAPGSGKTTTIIESLREIMPYVDRAADEKILVLAFNSKMKDEIENKAKEAGLDLSKLEIRTVHSLFFSHTWRFETSSTNKETAFKLDFTKGFFSKKMIRQVLDSLMENGQPYDMQSETVLARDRFFSPDINNEKNISILYRYVNAYYSSPYHISEINHLHKVALFFSKTDKYKKDLNEGGDDSFLISNLHLSESDKKIISERNKKLAASLNLSIFDIFFIKVLQRIETLAKLKYIAGEEIISEKNFSVDVVVLEKDGSTNKSFVHDFEVERKKINLHHVFEVPHNYYYKKFMIEAFANEEFIRGIFGKFKGVFIDEAQDNDMIFFQILVNVLTKKIAQLAVAVGDSHQGIYGFKSPDHFDILKYGIKNAETLRSAGIDVVELPLGETFRFGREIAGFTNLLFPESSISGTHRMEGFVSNNALDYRCLDVFTRNCAQDKNLQVGIVARTNNEAITLFVELSKLGNSSVKLHSSIKSDFKNFATKGLGAIDDERVRGEIVEALCGETGQSNKSFFSYDDIMCSDEAKKILMTNGYSQLIRFTKEDMDNHILTQDKRRKNVVITTAHQSKGAEFDYVIVAGDYFKKDLGTSSQAMNHFDAQSIHPIAPKETDASQVFSFMIGDTTTKESEDVAHTAQPIKAEEKVSALLIQDLIADPKMQEERNTLYVAITRAKKGVFFMEGNLFESLKPLIDKSNAWLSTERMAGKLLKENVHNGTIFPDDDSVKPSDSEGYDENSLFSDENLPPNVQSPSL